MYLGNILLNLAWLHAGHMIRQWLHSKYDYIQARNQTFLEGGSKLGMSHK